MYYKAIREKKRFNSEFGPLTVEQLFDLKIEQLKKLVIKSHKKLKELEVTDDDLSFLESNTKVNKELDNAKFEFELLKDVYTKRVDEVEKKSEELKKKREIDHLEYILAEREEQDLRGLSKEELEKKLRELKK